MSTFFKKIEKNDGNKNALLPSKKKHKKLIKGTTIFIILMLLYPVVQFCIMWFGVNINSILLTFQHINLAGQLEFYPIEEAFNNYIYAFEDMATNASYQSMIFASLAYLVLNCFITLPVSLFFAYLIFKKILGAGYFKTIYYLPSIIPIVALTLIYSSSFNNGGVFNTILGCFGFTYNSLFVGEGAKWMVWIFCFWTGLGYNIILLTSAMSRIPRELLEQAKMDGVKPLREFIQIVIPLSWPTITTLFVIGMLGVFGTYMQPMLLTAGQYDTNTIGLQIFYQSQGTALQTPATLGMICTLIGTPIVCGVRYFLNRCFREVNF